MGFKLGLILYVIIFLAATSCTIQKRSHRNGYYVDWNKKSTNNVALKSDFIASADEKIILPKKEELNFISLTSIECGDTLYLLSGEKIICQITEINETHIKYKKCDNLNGPVYSTTKTVASKIIYINHTSELFNAVDVKQIIQTNSCGDTIYLLNGEKIVCNVIDPNDDITTYQTCDQVNDSSKIISTSLIERIVYENGSEVLINQDPNKFFPKEEIDFIKSNTSCGDSIFLASGKVIQCKIIEIYKERLKYRKCDDTSTTSYIVERDNLYATSKHNLSERNKFVEAKKHETKSHESAREHNIKYGYHWTSKMSFLLGHLSLIPIFGFFMALFAISFSIIALSRLKNSKDRRDEKQRVIYGLILGIISLVLHISAFVLFKDFLSF